MNLRTLSWEGPQLLLIAADHEHQKYQRKQGPLSAHPQIVFEEGKAYWQPLVNSQTLPEELFVKEYGLVYKYVRV